MSLYEIPQPFCEHFNNSNPFLVTEDSSEGSFSMQYLETLFSDDYMKFPGLVDELIPVSVDHILSDQLLNISDGAQLSSESIEHHEKNSNCLKSKCHEPMDLDEFEFILNDDLTELFKSLDKILGDEKNSHFYHDNALNMCESSSLIIPYEGMQIDTQLSLSHLFMAYAESAGNQETKLSAMIAQRIVEKVNPFGGAMERVLYYMFRHLIKQSDYLIQESINSFYPAFKAIYQMFPYGRLIHHLTNSSIFEALSSDIDILNIIDFDIGEGMQWASLIDDIIKYQVKEVCIISVQFDEDGEASPSRWQFDETKRRLGEHARSNGLKLNIEGVQLHDLESLFKNMSDRRRMFVFNCNVGLPHMGRARSKKDVFRFLNSAGNFLHHVRSSKGIITHCDGDVRHDATSSSNYSSFMIHNLEHYRVLLESMEFDFPNHLQEARTALECLFVAPYVSSVEWDRKWEEIEDVQFELRLKGLKFSEPSFVEAKKMVEERGRLYGVRLESGKNNEIVLDWNGSPLVKLSCWKS